MTGTDGGNPFGTGPFQALLQAMRLPAGADAAVGRRVMLAVLLAWVPLVVLAQVQGLAIGTGKASVLQDFAAYARFLVAVPLLVLAEKQARTWMLRVMQHFPKAELISAGSEPRFRELLESTRRLLASRLALAAILVLAYALTIASAKEWVAYGAASWTVLEGEGGQLKVSYAGWWRLMVSQPLFMSLVLTWFWRLFLWFRCMRTIAHMDVRIVASHPDKMGGLGFLGQSLRGFPILAFALGSAVAGTLANLVVHEARPSTSLTPVVVATMVFILLDLCRPAAGLHQTDAGSTGRCGTELWSPRHVAWGAIRGAVARPGSGHRPRRLKCQIFRRLRTCSASPPMSPNMRPIPIEIKDFFPLLLATVLPFLPIILRQVSFEDLLTVAKRMLM